MALTEGIFPAYGAQLLNSTFRGAAFPSPFATPTYVLFCLDHPGITGPSIASASAAYTTRTPFAFSPASSTLATIGNSALVTVGPLSVTETWRYFVCYNAITGGTAFWSGTVNGGVGASVSSGTSPTVAIGELILSFGVAS